MLNFELKVNSYKEMIQRHKLAKNEIEKCYIRCIQVPNPLGKSGNLTASDVTVVIFTMFTPHENTLY